MPDSKDKRPNPLFMKTGEPDEVPVGKAEQKAGTSQASPTQNKKHSEFSNDGVRHRKKHQTRFLDVYRQFSSYIHKDLEPRVSKLLETKGMSKTELLNEAITDLLKKHNV